jgi:hypothetical protein
MNETKQIFLNSKYGSKLNGTLNSEVQFNFENGYHIPEYDDVFISIENAIIPISFYMFTEYNNQIIIDDINYNITPGNYTIDTLILELNNILPLTASFNLNNNKITFSHTSNFTLNICNAMNHLGFYEKDHYSVNNTLESDEVIDLSGNNMLYIQIEEFSSDNINSYNGKKGHTFCSIPIDIQFGDILTYHNISNISTKINSHHLTKITIRMLDEDFNPIDFHDKNWSLTILIKIYENLEKKKKYMILRDFLLNKNMTLSYINGNDSNNSKISKQN